ncbi:MAG: septum formation initiator family protein [Rickettsiales bacterium]|jgi:cell division protein FtsB
MSRYAGTTEFRQPLQRRAIGSLFCVLILFYLAFHTVSGERGVFALIRETGKLNTLEAQLAELKSEREIIGKKLKNLNASSIDLDLLDEQAHRVLGHIGEDEVVVFLDEDPSS